MEIAALLSEDKKRIDRALDRIMPRGGQLARAMRYSLFAGGKRFRPILCLNTARAFGADVAGVVPFACAVELVHTFTLVHDDLPAMDNSDLRRGKPTSHKVFGEALAILAGDALNTLAFRVTAPFPAASAELAAALLKVVEGQVSDIESVNKRQDLRQLRKIHRWKTAALLGASVRGAAVICGASPRELRALTSYADHLGMAFQIKDDILDVTASREQVGKPVKADRKKGFPFFLGLARSIALAEAEKEKACSALAPFGKRGEDLKALAEFVVKRGH